MGYPLFIYVKTFFLPEVKNYESLRLLNWKMFFLCQIIYILWVYSSILLTL